MGIGTSERSVLARNASRFVNVCQEGVGLIANRGDDSCSSEQSAVLEVNPVSWTAAISGATRGHRRRQGVQQDLPS